ncbi:MAG: c-type cytochrome [Gammaproteobacteria bacterium]|nr:c-type cytochrome [Gammaproteobacteria bacterium]
MKRDKQHGGIVLAALLGGAAGIGIIMVALSMARPDVDALATVPEQPSADYGRRLLRDTAELMGPGHENPELRYTGSHLDCSSCHLDTGTKPGTLSLMQSASRYPRFSGRDGGEGDMRDRINGCMTRSMNGRELPRDSVQMVSMELYINSLQAQYSAMSASRRTAVEPAAFAEPDRAADLQAGQLVYEERCVVCHGVEGQGLQATLELNDGYVFPPLWGPDSFNDGAGMNRVLTASLFIKARMPLGQPDLTDDQAFDVAAYINSKERPHMANLEQDYPDRTTKPVDGPYPPYADDFPIEQHRFGPFRPIREFYASQKK